LSCLFVILIDVWGNKWIDGRLVTCPRDMHIPVPSQKRNICRSSGCTAVNKTKWIILKQIDKSKFDFTCPVKFYFNICARVMNYLMLLSCLSVEYHKPVGAVDRKYMDDQTAKIVTCL